MPEAMLKQFEHEKRFFSPRLFFVLCFILTLSAWYVAATSSNAENAARFDRAATTIMSSFKNRMTVYTSALIYTKNLMNLKPDLSKDEFKEFVRGMNLENDFPGIQTIGYVKRFSRTELRQNLKTLPEISRSVVENEKSNYDIVYYVESIVNIPNNAIGMDLSVSMERREAMEKAAEIGLPVATNRVYSMAAVNTSPTEQFFLVFVPHYKNGFPLETPEQRKRALAGFVYGAFRTSFLFGNIAGDAKMQDNKVILQVFDGSSSDPEKMIFSKGHMNESAYGYYKQSALEDAHHTWTVAIAATSTFIPAFSRFLPFLILLVGLILTLVVSLSASKAKKFAEKLEEDILIRRQAEAQLKEEKQLVELTSKIGTTLKAEQDLESIVQLVTDVATDLTNAKYGAFFYNTYNDQGEILNLFSLSGADKSAFAKFGMPRNTDVFRPTFEGTSIIRVDDITKDSRYGRMSPHDGMPQGHLPVKSYLAVPVISKAGKVLGCLLFGHPEPGVFTQRAEDLVVSLAIQAAGAMDNANLFRELSQARAAADSANQAKSLFLANVSHEIRTPLGILLGFAELTLENKSNPIEVEGNLKKIIRSGRELTRILGEVLDLSKIEANALLIENSTFLLESFLKDIESEWGPQFDSKNLKFDVKVQDLLPQDLKTDSTRLMQILVNLLSNSLKFTEKGSVKMTVGLKPENPNFLQIIVEDTGLGISDTNKNQLFKSFSQGDSSITRRYGGSGLGLALSKQLSKALGGDLQLSKSELGKGSTFSVEIPLRKENESFSNAKPAQSSASLSSLADVRVLLVEDSIDNQLLIGTFLKKANAIVETANNGEEGVQKAMAKDYDIILMDIQMPILDGYGAFEKLKSMGYKKPIIALTAHALIEEKEKAHNMGFSKYLTKPVNRHTLVNTIAEIVTS